MDSRKERKKSGPTCVGSAYATISCKLFPSSRGNSMDVDPFSITCYQHNLSSARIPSYNPIIFLCWRLLGRSHRVALCQFAGSYDNVSYTTAPSSLAFRQRRGIAVRIEAMRFEGTRADRYDGESPLILEETLTTSPTNDLAVPPSAWSINRPDIEQRIRDRLRCSPLFKRVDGRHFRTCPRKGKRTIIVEIRDALESSQAMQSERLLFDGNATTITRRCNLFAWMSSKMSAVTFVQRAALANTICQMSSLKLPARRIFPH